MAQLLKGTDVESLEAKRTLVKIDEILRIPDVILKNSPHNTKA